RLDPGAAGAGTLGTTKTKARVSGMAGRGGHSPKRNAPKCIGLTGSLILTLAGVSWSAFGAERTATSAPSGTALGRTGFYAGGHVGQGFGSANAVLFEPPTMASDNSFGSLYGGAHGGYNYRLPSGILLGAEADLSFPNYFGADDVVWDSRTP